MFVLSCFVCYVDIVLFLFYLFFLAARPEDLFWASCREEPAAGGSAGWTEREIQAGGKTL